LNFVFATLVALPGEASGQADAQFRQALKRAKAAGNEAEVREIEALMNEARPQILSAAAR